jgi:glc operon protein GlcG
MNGQQLNLELAQKLIAAAIDEARQQGVNIAVSVVDSGGHLISFARMDAVAYMAIDMTRRKALTACNFQMPSDALQAICQSQPAFAVDLAKNADICLLGGGLPISLALAKPLPQQKPLGTRIDSQCVGGLGIVGASEEVDRSIAEKAISLLL